MTRFLTATLLTSAVMLAPALAQTPEPSSTGSTATPTERMNAAPASNTGEPAATGADASVLNSQSENGFFTYQEGNQMLGSGLMGANMLGAEGEDIGDVEDLLLDRNGQVIAVVVGVGGFLGIGEKDVAIANDQLEFVLAQDAGGATAGGMTADTAGTSQTTPAPGTATTGSATTATGSSATTPAGTTSSTLAAPGTEPVAGTNAMGTADSAMTGTGSTDGNMGEARGNYGWGWTGAGIDHIRVNYTRDQLEDAPAFEYAD